MYLVSPCAEGNVLRRRSEPALHSGQCSISGPRSHSLRKEGVEKYTNVIHSFLDTFDSDDWDTKVDFDVVESV